MQKQHFKDGMIDDGKPTCGASRAGRQAKCCREEWVLIESLEQLGLWICLRTCFALHMASKVGAWVEGALF
jgi:hypothetical protein